ncbi:MAG TPA: sigma factor, partial [Polyangiaceae bacterium]|nr:sigma factor [Polyangiaceae bacterium]
MGVHHAQIQRVVRQHYGAVLARLVRSFGDLHLAEDALQEALTAAYLQWSDGAIPDSPRAWLLTTARHKAVDEVRKRVLRGEKHEQILREQTDQAATTPEDAFAIGDDMLRLMFTCCHPALEPS